MGTSGDAGFLPHAAALVEVAKDKFQFHTASENPALPSADKGMDQRMVRLEEAVAPCIFEDCGTNGKAVAPPLPGPAQKRTKAGSQCRGHSRSGSRSGSVSPVDAASLQDMARLLGGNQLLDPEPKCFAPKPVLDASAEKAAEEAGAGVGFGSREPPPLATAVLKFTSLVEDMQLQKTKRGAKLEQALDGAVTGASGRGRAP